MTTDIFYATIKLVSGEELISKVCAFIENGEELIILDNPVVITLMEVKNSKTSHIKITPWISSSEKSTHIINKKHIITMNEIKDDYLIKVHNQYFENINNTSNEAALTVGMGYVSSINDARKSLEELYQAQEHPKGLD
jgi:hypothetical protein